MSKKVDPQLIEDLVSSLSYTFKRVGKSTVIGCWSFLPNGFQVGYGSAACIDPANFDRKLGRKLAKKQCMEKSRTKLWELEGYKASTLK